MGRIEIFLERCKACAICVEMCKDELIEIGDELNTAGYKYAVFIDDEEKCKACRICAEMCPDVAIEVYK